MKRIPFSTLDEFRQLLGALPAPDSQATGEAKRRNDMLTKPAGALGRLETIAIWFAGWHRTPTPAIDAPSVVIFAGNHGVASRGVSAYPSDVTAQMVKKLSIGWRRDQPALRKRGRIAVGGAIGSRCSNRRLHSAASNDPRRVLRRHIDGLELCQSRDATRWLWARWASETPPPPPQSPRPFTIVNPRDGSGGELGSTTPVWN